MNWEIGLILFLVAILTMEIPRLLKLRSSRDMLVFIGVWGIAVAAAIAHKMNWPYLRPLDWVKNVIGLLTG